MNYKIMIYNIHAGVKSQTSFTYHMISPATVRVVSMETSQSEFPKVVIAQSWLGIWL